MAFDGDPEIEVPRPFAPIDLPDRDQPPLQVTVPDTGAQLQAVSIVNRPGPVSETVFDQRLDDTKFRKGNTFRWARGTLLGILIQNRMSVKGRVEVHGNTRDARTLLDKPLKTIDIGPGGRIQESLTGQGGDDWLPFLFPNVRAVDDPDGQAIVVRFGRIGV